MKELIFVRHAKSDWGNEYLKDIDRYLSDRGYSDAYLQSDWYLKNKNKPDQVLSSTATRALNTALIFSRALGLDMAHFKLEKQIYEATVDKLIALIKEQDDRKNTVMIFGHNPSFTDVCNKLSEDMFFDNVPTCGIVSLSFEITKWEALEEKKGKLNFYHFPKEFRNQD